MGFLKTHDERPEFRQAKPVRHLTPQHAPFVFGAANLALAGDHQHEGHAAAVGPLQKAKQCMMGADLGHAVQIEAGLDLILAAGEPGTAAPAERHQGRNGGRARFRH